MCAQPIKLMGEISLLEKALPVENFNCQELDQLIETMKATMIEKNGVGLAAPQIGVNQRVIVYGFDKNIRYPNEKPIPFTVLINPEMQILTEETLDNWEGCLSVPGLRARVPRFSKLKYTGMNQYGESFSREVSDFHARIIQHEIDHLDGVLFPRRVKDLRYFGFEEVIKQSGLLTQKL